MTIDTKTLTALVKATNLALKRDHGIKVPHTALQASLLAAMGENAHAFSKKEGAGDARLKELIAEAPQYFHPGYDFDGKKLAWLERAGLVPKPKKSKTPPSLEVASNLGTEPRWLYLAEGELGNLGRLALTEDGRYCVPDGFDFSGCSVVALDACVPRVSKYGLPDYLSHPAGFFNDLFGLEVAAELKSRYADLGDDSGDSCQVIVQMPQATWERLISGFLTRQPTLKEGVAEWVGQHYGKNFAKESLRQQMDWAVRYMQSASEDGAFNYDDDQPPAQIDAEFEWLYPDQSSDSLNCAIDLTTGLVLFADNDRQIEPNSDLIYRVLVEYDDDSEMFDVRYRETDEGEVEWRLAPQALKELVDALTP